MNNTSTSADGYVPSSMLSFVSMENNGNSTGSKNSKHHHHHHHSQVWDWVDYGSSNHHHHQLATTPTPVATATPPFLSNAGGNPFLDCQSSLLPMPATNFPFYSPLQPDFHHHQPNGLIKMEDGSDMVAVGQIGLNLGHRTYFSSGDTLAIDRLFRRSRGLYQMNQQIPRCQAEGCKADLSGAKHYHRRHKVCEFHSKATVVVANGLQQRFCQQCSRFHVLSEFDEAKRSCRKRLADHNRRRRKPQPTTSQSSTDPSAPNNSTETSTDETKQQTAINQSSSRQISANTGTAISSTAAAAATVCTFTTNSMCIDSPKDRNHNHHHHHHQNYQNNDNRVTLSSNGPCLSLGGAEDGNFGLYSTNSYSHQSSRPFVVMSDDDNSHYHHNNHMSTSSSSATYYHQPHHNFFNDASQSTSGVRASDQTNQQSNQMQHLGQGLFEVDFM